MNYARPRIQRLFSSPLMRRPTLAMPEREGTSDWRVRKLREFMEASSGKTGGDLRALCRHLQLGITASHASKLFKRLMGIGPREYAKRLRLKRAADRLRGSGRLIKEIAADLGYQSPRDLARRFKKVFHLSPTEFRKMQSDWGAEAQNGRSFIQEETFY